MSHTDVIGIDLGGTKCAISRFDVPAYKKMDTVQFPTRAADGFSVVLDDVIAAVKKMRTPETKAVGIGVPGLVKQPEGILSQAPNIKASKDIPIKKILEKALSLPIFVSNDANCFALAEAVQGSGKGKKVIIGITFGTGIGGGIVIGGKLFEGSRGFAGEIGHMLLVPGKPPYKTDDMRGEVEQFLSGAAMGKRCEAAATPEDYLEGAVCSFMQPDIYREVAWLCTSLIHLLDPDMIVFGGSAGRALGSHTDEIIKELKKWILPGTPLPEITTATLPDAGTLGAALLCA